MTEEIAAIYTCTHCETRYSQEKNQCAVCGVNVCPSCSMDLCIQEIHSGMTTRTVMYLPCCNEHRDLLKRTIMEAVVSLSKGGGVEVDIKKLRTEQLKIRDELNKTKAKLDQMEEDNDVLRSLMVWKNKKIKEYEEDEDKI